MADKSYNYERIFENAVLAYRRDPSASEIYEDAFAVLLDYARTNPDRAHELSRKVRDDVVNAMALRRNVSGLFNVYRRSLLFDAPVDLDSYMLYLEIERRPQERFYQPRRRVLKNVVDNLQALTDNRLDELFLSFPPRTGKTTLLMFYITWLIGRDSERSNLYSAFSETITSSFYSGVLEILQDPLTYKWADVFPGSKLALTNAKENTIDINRRKRYHSLTCRSLYGTLNGACDCNGILMSDDLIGGIEEALNKDRMVAAWSKVDNNLIPRAKESAKILWCGTRWSMIDPAGLRMDLLMNDPRFCDRRVKIINLPALNELDESNFVYDYGVGFSSEYYKQRRASFERNNDMASWAAQYMGEPIEREGTLFSPGDMRYFRDLPGVEPDRIFMAIDPAFGGGDYVAAPICYQYDRDIYVVDVVYSNADKRVTQPLLASKMIKHNVMTAQIEASLTTMSYREGVAEVLSSLGGKTSVTTRPAPNTSSKEQRIFDVAPDIREHMLFMIDGARTAEYQAFMQNVFAFKLTRKNKHDDAPDSLTMAMNMVLKPKAKTKVTLRPY